MLGKRQTDIGAFFKKIVKGINWVLKKQKYTIKRKSTKLKIKIYIFEIEIDIKSEVI